MKLAPDDQAGWARLREEFYLPPGQIYLDGNSLGLLSRRAESAVLQVLADWSARGIGGWTEAGWLDLAERTATRLGPLLGAAPPSVALTAQTTVNLHQLLATLATPGEPGRRTIVADALNFASDVHAIASHLRLRGLDPATHLRLVTSADGFTLRTADILAALTPDVAVVVLPSVLYVSGQLLDLPTITRAARDRGILIGWDLSHSIGIVPHDLEADGVDFAFWCNYKYLNAGPGAVGGLFLHPRHHQRTPGLAGWWGVQPEARFDLRLHHQPAPGAARLQIGTPAILSLAPLSGSLELFAEVGGIEAVRARSLLLTTHLRTRVRRDLARSGFTLVTPDRNCGGHIALAHPAAGQICPALRAVGVVPDYRHPGILRFAPSPFYTTQAEIDVAVDRLMEIMRMGAHRAWPVVKTAAP